MALRSTGATSEALGCDPRSKICSRSILQTAAGPLRRPGAAQVVALPAMPLAGVLALVDGLAALAALRCEGRAGSVHEQFDRCAQGGSHAAQGAGPCSSLPVL